MKKIYAHFCHVDINFNLSFHTYEYTCYNFDSKQAKNYLIGEEGEKYKRQLDRELVGKVYGSNLALRIYFFDDPHTHKQTLKKVMEKELSDTIAYKTEELSKLKKIKINF